MFDLNSHCGHHWMAPVQHPALAGRAAEMPMIAGIDLPKSPRDAYPT